jgi:hypothetical protein
MKEQILTLEPTDDLHSLRDKIARVQAERLILMWPARTHSVSRRLDLELMKRWAFLNGSELVVISADGAVRSLARQSGVPCFPSLRESALAGISVRPSPAERPPEFPVRRRPAPVPPPRRGRRPLPSILRIGCFPGAVLALPTVFLLLLPTARLQVVFPSHPVTAESPVDPSLCTDLSLNLSLSDRRPTSGRIFAPTAYAKGTVRVTNFSDHAVTLPQGVRVASADGVLFETVEGTILPPGESGRLAVRAVEPGPESNLFPGGIRNVLGPLGLSVSAENPEPLSGGTAEWRNAVDPEDIDSLWTALTEQALQEARTSLQTLAGPASLIVEDSLHVAFDPQDEPDASVHTPVDTVGLTLHAEASMRACSADAVRKKAEALLEAQIPPGEILFGDTLTLLLRETADGAIALNASGTAVAVPDRNVLSLALRAQTPEQAVALLEDRFDAVEVSAVELQPGWIPILPLFPYQICIAAEAG